jgi:putative endonuclease
VVTLSEYAERTGSDRRRFAREGGVASRLIVHFVYIVRCRDGSFYTGYARDPQTRLQKHNAGRGAKYTSGRRPVKLVYSEACPTLSDALKREHELKNFPRSKKQALVRAARRARSAPGTDSAGS